MRFEFGIGVVGVTHLALTNEMMLTKSNGENKYKSEFVIGKDLPWRLESFSGKGITEFPGGAIEPHYFKQYGSLANASVHALIEEIDQELSVEASQGNIYPLGDQFLVFQKRVNKYVLFLVKPYSIFGLDDALSKRVYRKKSILVSPFDYQKRIQSGELKIRPRDRILAKRFADRVIQYAM